MSDRLTGVVLWFDSAKGYGFIQRDDNDEIEDNVFCHYSAIATAGYRSLEEGQRVEFGLVDGQPGKGKQAGEVTII